MNFICFFLLYFFKVATRTFKVTYTPHLWLAFCFHRMAWAKRSGQGLGQRRMMVMSWKVRGESSKKEVNNIDKADC